MTRDDASCASRDLAEVADGEIVVLVGLQPVPLAEELARLDLRLLDIRVVAPPAPRWS
jgi:hypothetical protein